MITLRIVTAEILDSYVAKSRRDPAGWPVITALHRYQGPRGKQNALNDALKIAKGEIVLVFDADYLPPRDIIRSLAANFKDPEVGAVMGRVIPINTKTNLLTRLEDLERTGGYQILLTRLIPFLFSSKLTFRQKFDGTLVLFIYLLPLLWWISWFLLFVVWFIDDIGFAQWLMPVTMTLVHGSVGNFAPFFQIGIGSLLDGSSKRVLLLPYFLYYFSFSLWFSSLGALQAFVDVVTRRAVTWQKTERIRAT